MARAVPPSRRRSLRMGLRTVLLLRLLRLNLTDVGLDNTKTMSSSVHDPIMVRMKGVLTTLNAYLSCSLVVRATIVDRSSTYWLYC